MKSGVAVSLTMDGNYDIIPMFIFYANEVFFWSNIETKY